MMKEIIFLGLLITAFSCGRNQTDQQNPNLDTLYISKDTISEMLILQSNTDSCIYKLIEAAKDNNLEEARALLENGCDVNGKIEIGSNKWTTPLRYGIHHDDSEMAKLLLEYGADPFQDLGRVMSPFHYSAGESKHETFLLLASKCNNVNIINYQTDYRTPLIWAISRGKIENFNYLIGAGAKVNNDSLDIELTPLAVALLYNQLEMFKTLLGKGADVNAKFSEVAEDCINCPFGITILHVLVNQTRNENLEDINEYFDLIFANNLNVNIESDFGYTALEEACFYQDTNVVNFLISKGAKLETEEYSAIHSAATLSNYLMVEFLLKKGVDPNIKDHFGNTPLLVCYGCCGDGLAEISIEDRLKTIRLLLEFGANPIIKNDQNESLIDKCNDEYRNPVCDSIDFGKYKL